MQNFRLRAAGEAAFALNEPHRGMGMVERIPGLAPAGHYDDLEF